MSVLSSPSLLLVFRMMLISRQARPKGHFAVHTSEPRPLLSHANSAPIPTCSGVSCCLRDSSCTCWRPPSRAQRPGQTSCVFDNYLSPTLCLYTSRPEKHPQGLRAGSGHYLILFPPTCLSHAQGMTVGPSRASCFPLLSLASLLHHCLRAGVLNCRDAVTL